MFKKIKKIKKIVESKVITFGEIVATFIARSFEVEKSGEGSNYLLCRSTESLSVDRHRDKVGLLFLQHLPSVHEEVNPSIITRGQLNQISVPAKDVLIRQKTPSQTCPTNPPFAIQFEKLETSSPEEVSKATHEDKIMDLSPSATLPFADTRRIRGRLSRPFDSCD